MTGEGLDLGCREWEHHERRWKRTDQSLSIGHTILPSAIVDVYTVIMTCGV